MGKYFDGPRIERAVREILVATGEDPGRPRRDTRPRGRGLRPALLRASGPPVWFHGDVAVGNLLVKEGRLAAVIDFGTSGVGDPACDLAIAWTLFGGESRDAFRAALRPDDATWARGRGWTLWKALITLAEDTVTNPTTVRESRRVIDEVLADHRSGA